MDRWPGVDGWLGVNGWPGVDRWPGVVGWPGVDRGLIYLRFNTKKMIVLTNSMLGLGLRSLLG